MSELETDLLVVGGGINGAGIARDAAGRGLGVVLCEQDDLASHTSSASSKLIHGGLRYLEHGEFRLVRKALAEREVLLRAAPHIIWPLRFVMPHVPQLRPGWMIRLGLFLYDHLDFGKRRLLPGSRAVDLRSHPAGSDLHGHLRRGYEYSDCWVQDSRLVVLNAMDGAARGAIVRTRTRCTGAERGPTHWTAHLEGQDGRVSRVRARALVNATGPWVASFLDQGLAVRRSHGMRLVKGSHVVVPALFNHPYAYIFQNPDRRIVFAIPYEGRFTLVGTTDVAFDGDPAAVRIDDDEVRYLCETANRYFRRSTTPDDVVQGFSGVRPLLDDSTGNPAAVTRDYRLELDTDGAPVLSVFGGKITTYRKLAEETLDRLGPLLGRDAPAWTGRDAPLPGGDIPDADYTRWASGFAQAHPWLPRALANRWTRNYGTRAAMIVDGAQSLTGLGEYMGDGIYAAELRYLAAHEWARTAEDVLWRRSRLGLHVSPSTRERIEAWMHETQVSAA